MAEVLKIAIEETDVFGVKAYRARCLNCGWKCCKQDHAREATAVRHAQKHNH